MQVMEIISKTYLLEAEEIETLEKAFEILEDIKMDMNKNKNNCWYMPSETLNLITEIYLQAKDIDGLVMEDDE